MCYRILKTHIAELPSSGRTSEFSVYDQVGATESIVTRTAAVVRPHSVPPPSARNRQEMSLRLLARLVRAAHGDWKAKLVNEKAQALQQAISQAKNGMATWHAPTPQVGSTPPARPSPRGPHRLPPCAPLFPPRGGAICAARLTVQ